MMMNEKRIKRWQRIRSRGKTRYVWLPGVLEYALIPILARLLAQFYYFFTTGAFDFFNKEKIELVIQIILFGLWGYANARQNWQTQERAYAQDQVSVSNISEEA
jgi:hypothetical protein